VSSPVQSWQTAEIPGPKRAFVISKPDVVSAMIGKTGRVLVVVGSDAGKIKTKDGDLVDSMIRLSKTGKVQLAATGHLAGEFVRRGFNEIRSTPLFNLGDRLRDPAWKGLDGEGPYGLVIFVGFLYYYEWLVLSGLKHFASHLRTISLGQFYQPHSSFSFLNSSSEEWTGYLDKIIHDLEVNV